jgi:hypothetical protein
MMAERPTAEAYRWRGGRSSRGSPPHWGRGGGARGTAHPRERAPRLGAKYRLAAEISLRSLLRLYLPRVVFAGTWPASAATRRSR